MIGVYGGTFDPVHIGHLRTALDLHETLGLDEVRLIPARLPPHRDRPRAGPEQRLDLLRAAVDGQPGLVVDDRELSRPGPSYMVDTLRSLRDEYGDRPLALILGMDAFLGLDRWHHWQRLFELAHVLVMRRPGIEPPARGVLADCLERRRVVDAAALRAGAAGRILLCEVTPLAISATDIRERLRQGRSIRYLVPDAVWRRIHERGLYGTVENTQVFDMQAEELKDLAFKALDDMKGQDITVLDVRGKSSLIDYMVIASGTSNRHVRAMAEDVALKAKQAGMPPLGVEDDQSGEWVLVDLGDVVVHVMQPATRDFYNLEKLWQVDEDIVRRHRGDEEPG